MITEFKIFESLNTIGPLYHGSKYLFDEFSHEKIGQDDHLLSYLGSHFTPDKKIAFEIANRSIKALNRIIYTVDITVNKTLEITEGDLVKDILKWGYDKQYFKYRRNGKELDIKWLLKLPYANPNKLCIMDELIDEEAVTKDISHKDLSHLYKRHLVEQGYDSIKYLNEIEFEYYDKKINRSKYPPTRYDWIVFNTNQIKIIDIQKL